MELYQNHQCPYFISNIVFIIYCDLSGIPMSVFGVFVICSFNTMQNVDFNKPTVTYCLMNDIMKCRQGNECIDSSLKAPDLLLNYLFQLYLIDYLLCECTGILVKALLCMHSTVSYYLE